MQRRGDHWYCSPCFTRPEVCSGCGNARKASFRDRHGRPRCSQCPDHDPRDPRDLLVAVITAADPGLDTGTVNVVLRQVVTKAAHLQKLAWALDEEPGLLTGDGARAAFLMILRLIDALCEAGATRIMRPACPFCGRVVTLSKLVNGQRACRACTARSRAVPCGRCGRICEPASRTPDGQPLCPYCLINDPDNLEDCVRCGRRQRVAVRTPEGPVCGSCNPRQVLTCAVCGRTAPCMISKVTGKPWCAACASSWATCSGCGHLAPVKGGTRDQPLCADCVAPDGSFWKACPGCGTPGRILAGACRRCHLRDQADHLLADPGAGRTRAGLEPLRQAIIDADRPAIALACRAATRSAPCSAGSPPGTARSPMPPWTSCPAARPSGTCAASWSPPVPFPLETSTSPGSSTGSGRPSPAAPTPARSICCTPTRPGRCFAGFASGPALPRSPSIRPPPPRRTSPRPWRSWTGLTPAASPWPPALKATWTPGWSARAPPRRAGPGTSSAGPAAASTPAWTSPPPDGTAPPAPSTPRPAGIRPGGSSTTRPSSPKTGSPASPLNRPVPARRRGPGRHPRPHARHPHQRRRRMAARLQRRLGRLRRRRQPQEHVAARSVTSRNTSPDVTAAARCPVCEGQMPDRDRSRNGRKAWYCREHRRSRLCSTTGTPTMHDTPR